jgi:hypothetical protein
VQKEKSLCAEKRRLQGKEGKEVILPVLRGARPGGTGMYCEAWSCYCREHEIVYMTMPERAFKIELFKGFNVNMKTNWLSKIVSGGALP